MNYDVYLICFLGTTRPVEAVKELWPENRHLTGPGSGFAEGGAEVMIIAAERKNEILLVKDVYDKIEEKAGSSFRSIIVPMTSVLAGRHTTEVVEWINKVTQ